LPLHDEDAALIDAPGETVFRFIDDPARLASHMSRSSWMMGGGRMEVSVDEGGGRRVGSHIRLRGTVLGVAMFLDEVVTRHEPPRVKVWETVGEIKLLVIGHYRMTVTVEPRGAHSWLRVAVDYELPSRRAWMGRLFGGAYAAWCVRQMLQGARDHFASR